MIKGIKWLLYKELNRYGYFQPGRQATKLVSKQSVINRAALTAVDKESFVSYKNKEASNEIIR